MDENNGRVFAIGVNSIPSISKHHEVVDALMEEMNKAEEKKTMNFSIVDEFMKYAYEAPKMTQKEFIAQTKRTKPKAKKRQGKKKR